MQEAFLRAICAHPSDVTPRLVFADWLDENGEPERAEFIRLQIRIDDWSNKTCPGAPHGPPGSPPTPGCECASRGDDRRREKELLDTTARGRKGLSNGCCWSGLAPHHAYTFWYRRGFVEHILCSSDQLQYLDAIMETTPLLEVTLTTWPNGMDGIDCADLFNALIAGKRVTPQMPEGADHHLLIEWNNMGLRSPSYTLALLQARWPSIQKWTLPIRREL